MTQVSSKSIHRQKILEAANSSAGFRLRIYFSSLCLPSPYWNFENTRAYFRAPSGNKTDGNLRKLIRKHRSKDSVLSAQRTMRRVSTTAIKTCTSIFNVKKPRGSGFLIEVFPGSKEGPTFYPQGQGRQVTAFTFELARLPLGGQSSRATCPAFKHVKSVQFLHHGRTGGMYWNYMH